MTIDIDSSIHETYGLAKQGGAKFTHTKVRGYHPLYAVIAGTGDIAHSRMRGGNANSGRGAASFLTETFNRVRAAGATGPLTLRADSGFYAGAVATACRTADVRYSITVKQNPAIRTAIAAIDDKAWTPIPYFLDGADVAETTYKPFGNKADRAADRAPRQTHPRQPARPVRRLQPPRVHHRPRRQHHRARSRPPPPRRRRRRDPRPQIRCRSQPLPIRPLRRQRSLAQHERHRPQPGPLDQPNRTRRNPDRDRHPPPPTPTTPGPITRSARKLTLHLPKNWPWAKQFNNSLARLRTIVLVT